jgi:hypothetical protein
MCDTHWKDKNTIYIATNIKKTSVCKKHIPWNNRKWYCTFASCRTSLFHYHFLGSIFVRLINCQHSCLLARKWGTGT